jgi:hypothetical protein
VKKKRKKELCKLEIRELSEKNNTRWNLDNDNEGDWELESFLVG